MADTVKLLTTGPMAAAVIDSHTSETTGHEAEYLLDNNPDTYWQASTDGAQEIVIDLSSAIAINMIIIWLHNYTGITNNRTVVVTGSNDKATWSDTLWTWSVATFVSSAGPLRLPGDLTQAGWGDPKTAYRYYKIGITQDVTGSEVIELSGIWLCRLYAPSVGNQYPEDDLDIYPVRVQKSESGRKFTQQICSGRQYRFSRQFAFYSSADEVALRSAVLDCFGEARPLFLVELTTQTDAVMCHFASSEYNRARKGYTEYRPVIELESVPWIPAGSNY